MPGCSRNTASVRAKHGLAAEVGILLRCGAARTPALAGGDNEGGGGHAGAPGAGDEEGRPNYRIRAGHDSRPARPTGSSGLACEVRTPSPRSPRPCASQATVVRGDGERAPVRLSLVGVPPSRCCIEATLMPLRPGAEPSRGYRCRAKGSRHDGSAMPPQSQGVIRLGECTREAPVWACEKPGTALACSKVRQEERLPN